MAQSTQKTVHTEAHSAVEAVGVKLWEKSEIIKQQDSIKLALISLDETLHSNAVQCLLHCSIHRDTSLMRRLLVDIVDAKSGYRRQGLIAWMRTYSPMELSGDNINLSGKDANGLERPFMIEEANANPFRSDTRMAEVVRPFFQEGIRGKVSAAIKEGRAAINNVANGQPIDKAKPFYDGVDTDLVLKALDQLEAAMQGLPKDQTREIRKAQKDAQALGLKVIEGDKDKAAA